MKKTTLFLVFALLGLHFAAKAQALEIVNYRTCTIIVHVHVNGPCFGTSTCTLPAGALLTFTVSSGGTLSFANIALASAYLGGSLSCPPNTYEYVRADVQFALECGCGGGVSVGDPCTVTPPAVINFGPTCLSGSGCSSLPCLVMTRPFGPGSARIVAY